MGKVPFYGIVCVCVSEKEVKDFLSLPEEVILTEEEKSKISILADKIYAELFK